MPRLHCVLRRLALAAALLAVCSPRLYAQESANIIGQVRLTGGGLPEVRVRVTLHTRGMVIGDTFTDNEGRFGFYQLPANIYSVRINETDYEPVERTVTMSPVAISTQHVQLVLRPVQKAQPAEPRGPASGGNPYLVSPTDYTRKYSQEAVKEFEKGVAAEEENKGDDAIKYYRKAIEIEPDFYPARNNLGSRYLANGKHKEAEEQFEKVIELSPNDAQGYFNLGNVFCITDRLEDAERTIHEGLKRQPDAPLGHFLLGQLYLRAKFLDEAEKRLRWALQLDPSLSQAHIEIANLFLQRGDRAGAIAELRRFVEQYPGDSRLPQVKKLLAKLESEKRPSK